MADITMCTAKNCQVKHKCKRFTAIPDPMYQSIANFNKDKEINSEYECDDFWNNKREGKVNERKTNRK